MDSFMDKWLWEPAGAAFSVTYPAKTTLFAGCQFRRSAQLCGNRVSATYPAKTTLFAGRQSRRSAQLCGSAGPFGLAISANTLQAHNVRSLP
jgi:hypothetical protein